MKIPIKVIYVAGAFSGPDAWQIEQNIRRAETLSLEVWKAGHAAICPHKNTQHFSGVLPHTTWLEGDIEILRRCDAVLLVPGWENSPGTKGEITEAMKCGIHVFDLLEDLVKHFQWPKATEAKQNKTNNEKEQTK